MDDSGDPVIPFIQTNELFQFSDDPPPDPHLLMIPTFPPQEYLYGADFASNQRSNSLQPTCNYISSDNNNHRSVNRSEEKKKKISHRDIERQRRQEMAALYGSLRSQLPLEYLKGKRSVADQMQEAVKYIKHLKKKTEELSAKRDELKRRSAGSSENQRNLQVHECSITTGQEDTVMVNLYRSAEVEVGINTYVDQGLPLARVLEVLMEEGLSIDSCKSTRINGRLLHFIQCEVIDAGRTDINKLQQKIKESSKA